MKRYMSVLMLLFCVRVMAQIPEPNDSMALVNANVTDFQNHPRKADMVFFIGEKSQKEYLGVSNSDGNFTILVPKGETYLIKYKNFGDKLDYSRITIPDTNALLTINLTIRIDPPKTYVLKNVFFDTGKSTLKPESYKALNDLVEVMKLKESLIIEIAGHTDSIGSADMNLRLSFDRANAVRDYLIKNNISPERVSAMGYGETQPVADNGTEEGRRLNRRTEVRIIKE